MNTVLLLTHNCVSLTKKCVESVRKQDIETRITVVDNGSTDGTVEWGRSAAFSMEIREFWENGKNHGVSKPWNMILSRSLPVWNHCLVLNNDTELHPQFLSSLLSYGLPFVTGRETTDKDDLATPVVRGPVGDGPQFSAFLIRKDCWDKVGPFDERMWGWASDCDYHLRAHRKGIRLFSAPVPYYHERSSTIRLADPKERRWMQLRADADRQAFFDKWGFRVGSKEYQEAFSADTFGVESNL